MGPTLQIILEAKLKKPKSPRTARTNMADISRGGINFLIISRKLVSLFFRLNMSFDSYESPRRWGAHRDHESENWRGLQKDKPDLHKEHP
jgi:hypothetical protein